MPTISFYGIYISMYLNEHFSAHFHVEYQGQEAQINIRTGEIIKGNLPRQAIWLVEEWRNIHMEERLENLDNASKLINAEKNCAAGVGIMYYHIRNAACLKDYYVYLQFEDGTEGVVNLETIAGKGEIFAPLKDKDFFCRMRIESSFHTVEWHNGGDLSPEVLYEKVKHAPSGVALY